MADSNSDGHANDRHNALNKQIDSLFEIRAQRYAGISVEISTKRELDEAIAILRVPDDRCSAYAKSRIVGIIAQYHQDNSVDELDWPARKLRKKALENVSSASKALRVRWNQLTIRDQITVDFHTNSDPEMAQIGFDATGVNLSKLLEGIEKAAVSAVQSLPGKAGGAPKQLAKNQMAELCLKLYAEFREDGLSAGATKGGYPKFFNLVFGLATDEKPELDRAIETACAARKDGTGVFAIRVRDKT